MVLFKPLFDSLGNVTIRPVALLAAVLLATGARPLGNAGAEAGQTPRPPVVAAAASLNGALPEIAARFARERGTSVELVFGASGALTRQIQDGAPFELFLSADEEFPDRLTALGLTRDRGAVFTVGRLALYASADSPLAIDAGLDGLARFLESGRNGRFAIANPDVAPYGRAAEAVLRRRGLWDAVRPRLVLGDTVAQAAQFASTGNAIGGLVAYSLIVAPGFAPGGRHAVIPAGDYPPLRQRMVLTRRAGPVATAFYAYVLGDPAQATLERYGFSRPD